MGIDEFVDKVSRGNFTVTHPDPDGTVVHRELVAIYLDGSMKINVHAKGHFMGIVTRSAAEAMCGEIPKEGQL